MGTQLEIVADGRWLSTETLIGDVTMSTIMPGGSDQLSWTPAEKPVQRFHGEELVTVYYGGVPVWAGTLDEPDPSSDQLTAAGAFYDGDNFMALDGSGNATKIPDTAIDQAISRGLTWTKPTSIRSTAMALDTTSGPFRVGAMMDTQATVSTQRWGVDPLRQVFVRDDDTAPSYQTLPIAGGLGFARDNYASTLFARYLDGTGTPQTTSATDATAAGNHGPREDIVDLTFKGAVSVGTANTHVAALLALGKSTPQWTKPIEVSYGEILSMGGVPVALELVAAGHLLRVNGGFELAQRKNGLMYVDVPIGRTELSGGTLTITPQQIAPRNLTDLLATMQG